MTRIERPAAGGGEQPALTHPADGSPGGSGVGVSGGVRGTGDIADEVPARADGVELLGEMAGSGYRTPPALVRRLDGQVLQLTPLLYLVLEAIDGHRDYAAIGEVVSQAAGKLLDADGARTLVDQQLRPLGLARRADGASRRSARPIPCWPCAPASSSPIPS